MKAIRQVVETTHAEHLLWAHPVLEVLLVTDSTKHQQQQKLGPTATLNTSHVLTQSTLCKRDIISHFKDKQTEARRLSPVRLALDADSQLGSNS